MRTLGLTLILLPSVVLAQPAVAPAPSPAAEEQGECTVTTTVRCTGAAAPYAVQAAQPAPAEPPIVIQAPPAPPPVAAPAPIVPPQALVLDARHLVGEGWKLTQSADGRLWRERKTSTASPAMWGGGLALFATTYLAGGVGGMAKGDGAEIAWWPVIGPMFAAAFSDNSTARALFVVDGLAQGTGFVLFLVGLAAGPEKMERLPVSVGPIGLVGGGSGVALTGRF